MSELHPTSTNAQDEPDLKKDYHLEIDATREITAIEHKLKFWDAVKQYPSATFWSYFFGVAVIMAGFDAQIITSFYALPAFQNKYGNLQDDGTYEISAPWQLGLGMGNPIGQVLGALASGWFMEMYGRKKTLGACCVYSIIFVFLQFFSTSIGMLCAAEILGGLAYGFYVVIAPTYSSEICPLALRGVLTASVNLMFVIGQFIAQGCAAGLEARLDEWSYKIPFVSSEPSIYHLTVVRNTGGPCNDTNKLLGHPMDLARGHPVRPDVRSRVSLLAHPSGPQGGRQEISDATYLCQEQARH